MRPADIRLLLSTVRHLRVSQIAARARRTLRTGWHRITRKKIALPSSATISRHQPLWIGPADHDAAPSGPEFAAASGRAAAIAKGSFTFLALEKQYSGELDWNDVSVPRLWRFELHAFGYFADLLVWSALGNREYAFRCFRFVAESWIRGNQRMRGDGWHPYTVSLRIANWCQALPAFRDELEREREFAHLLIRSLVAQARFLFENLEFDVGGNHLIANARALVFAGIALEGREAERWLARGLDLLRTQIDEQVLADGGHFERTPAYHASVTRDLLEVSLVLRRNQRAAPWLEDAVAKMLEFLDQIIIPDGRLPLLKDTTFEGVQPIELLAAAAMVFDNPRWKRSDRQAIYSWLLFGSWAVREFGKVPINQTPRDTAVLGASGFIVIRDGADCAIVDVGKVGPDHLPAHAHADMFSYELAAGGLQMIVDSGVYTYQAGEWRQYFRSTRAHNTVEVDGADQSEMWSSFRVGRRATPALLSLNRDRNGLVVQAEHDGYRRRSGVTHRRTFASITPGILAIADELFGEQVREAVSRVHLHPEVEVDRVSDRQWRLRRAGTVKFLTAFGSVRAAIGRGWYSERFGVKTENAVLELAVKGRLPVMFGYVVGRTPVSIIELPARLELSWDAGSVVLDLRKGAAESRP